MSIDNRSKMVSFRLTEEEYDRFRDLCYAKGIPSVSEMARSAISALLLDADITDLRALTRRVSDLEGRLHSLTAELRECQQSALLPSPQPAFAGSH